MWRTRGQIVTKPGGTCWNENCAECLKVHGRDKCQHFHSEARAESQRLASSLADKNLWDRDRTAWGLGFVLLCCWLLGTFFSSGTPHDLPSASASKAFPFLPLRRPMETSGKPNCKLKWNCELVNCRKALCKVKASAGCDQKQINCQTVGC